MITLTQLQYIVAVEKFGNFRRAAKSCFVTQPTLSMQVQKLESDLGVVIFDRTAQPVTATPIGRRILEQSRVVLSQAERLTSIVDEAKNRIEGEVRLAVIPTLAPYLLPLFVDRFAKAYPQVSLRVEESKTDDIIRALSANQLDVGLLATPLGEAGIEEHPLFLEPFYVYAGKDTALGRLAEVSDSDLKDEQILLLAEGHCLRTQILRVCRNRRPKGAGFEFESGSIETLCHLVEKGHGYTVIPHLARTWGVGRGGSVVPFSEPMPSREVSLVVHGSFARTALLRALADSIVQSLPAELRKSSATLKPIRLR